MGPYCPQIRTLTTLHCSCDRPERCGTLQRDVFDAISPLDHRYYLSSPQLFETLSKYLSERAVIRYQARVEAALVTALHARGLCSADVVAEVEAACEHVSPAEAYEEEQRTRHNIRALVNVIRSRLSDEAKPFVHFTATSMDITDTARALQYKEVAQDVLIPKMESLMQVLIDLARREAHTIQMGRTHGQHAVPITFGFAVAEYVNRLGGRLEAVKAATQNLRGKMSGAVGAYNASHLFFDDPDVFEREVLALLGLEPSHHSTQVVEPEYVVDFIHAIVSAFGVLANFADDVRHLQRTEIGELGEAFEAEQVGSSTMPHKRNPWNYEHVKSLWKTFVPRMQTLYYDQISEHQRDLTNSASARFVAELIAGFTAALDRLERVTRRLVIDPSRMEANFDSTAGYVIAEPLYILLAAHGHPDAHEAVRRLTLRYQPSEGKDMYDLAQEDPALSAYLSRFTPEQRQVLKDPRRYAGIAARRTEEICAHWQARLAKGGDPQ